MLVAHYPLNVDARDYSGVCGNGVVPFTNAWGISKIGMAAKFTGGAGEVIQVSHGGILNFSNSDSRTITAFINVSSTSGWKTFFAPAPNNNTNDYQYVLTVNDVMKVEVWRQGGILLRTSNEVLSINEWYHVAVVFGNNKLRIYINGKIHEDDIDTDINNLGYTYTSTYLNIGGRPTTEYFNGMISDLRVYDEALSEDEINDIINKYNDDRFLLHYHLDDEYIIPTENLLQPNDFRTGSFGSYSPFVMEQIDEPLSPNGKGLRFHLPIGGEGFNKAGRTMWSVPSAWGDNDRRFSISFSAKGEGSTIGKPPKIYFGTWLTSNDLLEEDYKRFVFENIPITVFNGVGFGLREDWALGDIWYIHSPQIEEKSTVTPFTSTERIGGAFDLTGYHGGSGLLGDFVYVEDSPIGGGLRFNGIDTVINCGKICNLREELTVAAWIRYEGDFKGGVLVKGNAGGWASNSFMFLRVYSGRPYIRISNGTDLLGPLLPASLGDNKWHHIVATFDQENFKVYVDGENYSTDINTIGLINEGSGKDLIIGQGYTSSGVTSWYGGDVADIRIYARALSENEVAELGKVKVSFVRDGNILSYGISEGDYFGLKDGRLVAKGLDEVSGDGLSGSKAQSLSDGRILRIKGEFSEVR